MGQYIKDLSQHKPKRKGSNIPAAAYIAAAIVAVIAALYLSGILSGIFQRQPKPGTETNYGGAVDTTTYMPIDKVHAMELIKECKLLGFYYTNQTTYDNGGKGEQVATGIELTSDANRPLTISIADRHMNELVPIAREAQKKCSDLQFWHDGKYEEKQPDGSWR